MAIFNNEISLDVIKVIKKDKNGNIIDIEEEDNND